MSAPERPGATTLTVVIRDTTSLIHLEEPCTHRTVRISLTPEQIALLALQNKNEAISMVIAEPLAEFSR